MARPPLAEVISLVLIGACGRTPAHSQAESRTVTPMTAAANPDRADAAAPLTEMGSDASLGSRRAGLDDDAETHLAVPSGPTDGSSSVMGQASSAPLPKCGEPIPGCTIARTWLDCELSGGGGEICMSDTGQCPPAGPDKTVVSCKSFC